MSENTNKTAQQSNAINQWYTITFSTAILMVIASVIILVILLSSHFVYTSIINKQELELVDLKSQVSSAADKEQALEQIRQLDLQYRQNWFRRLDITRRGSYLLLGSVIIMLLGFKFTYTLSKSLPCPGPTSDRLKEQILMAMLSRRALIADSAVIVFIGLLLFLSPVIDFGVRETAEPIEVYFPTDEQFNNNWPRFRGPSGFGIVADTDVNYPEAFDIETGQGILWKAEVPLLGNNSPIVWDNRLFISGADPNEQHVFCYDTDTGHLLWTGDVTIPQLKAGQEPFEAYDMTGYAAPTMTTDGRSAFVIFPTGMVAGFDFAGNKIWEKDLGRPENAYGYACSLLMYQNLVIIQYDQAEEEDGKSAIMALDNATGDIVWQVKRPVGNSWATPIIVNDSDKIQLITCSDPWVISYNPADGTEIWRAKCLSGDVSISPSYSNGLVFVVEVYSRLIAIRTNGSGDVTETHIAWEALERTPETCSLINNNEYGYMILGDLAIGCFRMSDGEKLWEQDMQQYSQASPTFVSDKLYMISETGQMFVAQIGSEYKELAKSELKEACFASPAFVNGRIYIRSNKNLYCIGE